VRIAEVLDTLVDQGVQVLSHSGQLVSLTKTRFPDLEVFGPPGSHIIGRDPDLTPDPSINKLP
jgi:hypothetical protein